MSSSLPTVDGDGSLLIRLARDTDAAAVERLAALDGARRTPAGTVLVAELDGQLRAALALGDGSVVADPFVPTADLVALLRTRADLLRGARRARLRGPGLPRRRRTLASLR